MQLTSRLLEFRTKLLNAAIPAKSLQGVLFSFQDAVSVFKMQSHENTAVANLMRFLLQHYFSQSSLYIGEKGFEATAGETSLDVCSGQST